MIVDGVYEAPVFAIHDIDPPFILRSRLSDYLPSSTYIYPFVQAKTWDQESHVTRNDINTSRPFDIMKNFLDARNFRIMARPQTTNSGETLPLRLSLDQTAQRNISPRIIMQLTSITLLYFKVAYKAYMVTFLVAAACCIIY